MLLQCHLISKKIQNTNSAISIDKKKHCNVYTCLKKTKNLDKIYSMPHVVVVLFLQ